MSYEAAPSSHHAVPIQLTRDRRLSFRARAIAIRLLSNAPGFRMTAADLARESPNEGRRAILTAMKELRALGYSQVLRRQDERGRWHTVTRIFGTPQPECAESTPAAEVRSPNSGEPNPGGPAFGERPPKSSSTNKKYQEERTTTTQSALDWSAKGLQVFTEKDQAVVVQMIEDHEPTTQQELLDEIAARIEDKVASSHWGLLRELATRAKAGTFRLSRGRRINDARLARAQPKIERKGPGVDTESPYANAIAWAYQQFNVTGDRIALTCRLEEAAAKWPEEASKSHVTSTRPRSTAATWSPPQRDPPTQPRT